MLILMTWPVPSGAGPGLLLTTKIIMRTSMTQVIASLKGDAAGVFDWVKHNHHDTSDLSLIMEKIHNHYCSTLTFR